MLFPLLFRRRCCSANVARFSNVEMCRVSEQLIFTDPFFPAPRNRHTSPQLDADVATLHADVAARVAASRLKVKFTQQRQALIHADLHTGSIMATREFLCWFMLFAVLACRLCWFVLPPSSAACCVLVLVGRL